MSTKPTINHGDKWSVYREAEDGAIYVEIEGDDDLWYTDVSEVECRGGKVLTYCISDNVAQEMGLIPPPIRFNCSICKLPITVIEPFRGNGDGSGQNFAHEACYWRSEHEKVNKELAITEKLLAERQKVLEAIPSCLGHGPCVPHALEWINSKKLDDDTQTTT